MFGTFVPEGQFVFPLLTHRTCVSERDAAVAPTSHISYSYPLTKPPTTHYPMPTGSLQTDPTKVERKVTSPYVGECCIKKPHREYARGDELLLHNEPTASTVACMVFHALCQDGLIPRELA